MIELEVVGLLVNGGGGGDGGSGCGGVYDMGDGGSFQVFLGGVVMMVDEIRGGCGGGEEEEDVGDGSVYGGVYGEGEGSGCEAFGSVGRNNDVSVGRCVSDVEGDGGGGSDGRGGCHEGGSAVLSLHRRKTREVLIDRSIPVRLRSMHRAIRICCL